MPIKEISVVIPTYNERENIENLIPNLEHVLKENGIIGEIIIIDDNSQDGTARIVEEFNKKYKNIKLVSREKKEGVGSARKVGFSLATKEIIISMEGDNTHNPQYVPLFIDKIEKGYDLVIGSRYLKESQIVNWPLKRRIISKVANFIARFFAGVRVTDVTSGYRAFRKNMYSKFTIDSDGYPFNMEFACEAHSRGFKIAEIPIIFKDREKGKTKLKVTKELVSFITTSFRFAYTYRPVKVFGSLGILFIFFGILGGIYLTYIKIVTGIIGNRIPMLFLSVVFIISGIQIISFGLIVNIVSKLRRELIKS